MEGSEYPISRVGAGYLTAAQAAEYLQVSDRLIRREVAAGRLAVFKPLPKVTRFHRDDLDAWMRAGRRGVREPVEVDPYAWMRPTGIRRRRSRKVAE